MRTDDAFEALLRDWGRSHGGSRYEHIGYPSKNALATVIEHRGEMPSGSQIAKLCERLQGFPDDYTLIPWRTWQESARRGASYEGLLKERGMTLRGPSIEECPDGPRYKALGNSWPVPVVRWIGQRVDAAVKALL